VFYELII